MFRLRRALGPLAAVWLFCQAATLTLGSAALWVAAADAVELECTCAGDHGICPMHHKPADDSKRCLLQNAVDDEAGVLTTLFGQIGLVTAPVEVFVPLPILTHVLIDADPALLRPAPPDPPPPRS